MQQKIKGSMPTEATQTQALFEFVIRAA